MTIEDFDLSAFLPYRLSLLAERVSRRLAEEYRESHGISVAEWRVLAHLSRSGAVSVREIHACVGMDKPRVSRAVSRLDAQGLVAKGPDKADARLVAISLTPAGRRTVAEIVPAAKAVEAGLCAAADPRALEIFFDVIEKMHLALDRDPRARPRPDRG